IPASKSGWGSFYIVRDQALANMKTILDSCGKLENPARGSVAQQIGDLYAAAMDSTAIEKAGLTPRKAGLDRIASIKNANDVLNTVTSGFVNGHGALFGFYVSPDDKNSNVERAHFDQGGLGLPNKNYYFKDDSASRHIRKAYHQYVA